jgi:hypothetical protein
MLNRSIASVFCLFILSIIFDLSMEINAYKEAQFGGLEKTSQPTVLFARVVHDSGDGLPPPPPPQE